MKKIFILIFLTSYFLTFSQTSKYNLDFENDTINPWIFKNEKQNFILDKILKIKGNQSLLMIDTETSQMQGVENRIHGSFNGDSISFKLHIKTDDVNTAYFYMVIGTNETQKYFQMSQEIKGNTDWKEYEIKLPYSSDCDKITIALNFKGGKIWIDDVSLKINNINIEKLQPKEIIKLERNKSGFKIQNQLSKKEIDNLFLLGKVWGFLKYYHPEIVKNSQNWDNELFENFNLIYSEDFEIALINWIQKLGQIENMKYEIGKAKQKGDLNWINQRFKNSELQKTLLRIAYSKRENKQHSVEKLKYRGLNFINEYSYSTMTFDDDGIKLLALFRYWNIVEYWYPYKYLISKKWDSVLLKYIPKILKTNTKIEYAKCLNELIVEIEDSHAILKEDDVLTEYFGSFSLPVNTKFINKKLVIVDVLENSELQNGDIIISIENNKIETLIESLKKYSIASNEKTTLRNLASKIIRTNKKFVDVEILRKGKKATLKVNTIDVFQKISTPKFSHEINDKIGYINAETADRKEIDSLFKKWNSKNSIIIDLRKYPKENLAFVVSPFLHKKEFIGFQFSEAKLDFPGYFTEMEEYKFNTFENLNYSGNIYVLVDENTQSKGEFNAMVLQAYHKTKIIGSQTAGTDGSASQVILPGNFTTYITSEGVYYPDWRETQKTGIVPQVNIEMKIKDIINGEDRVLKKTIKLID